MCRSLALFWLKPLASTDRATQQRLRSVVHVLRRAPAPVKRMMAKAYWARQARAGHGEGVADTLRAAATGRDLLLIETQSALAGQIPAVMEELQSSSNGNRVELRRFESTSMQAFESLSEQEVALDAVIEWFDASFSRPSSEHERTPESASPTPTGSR